MTPLPLPTQLRLQEARRLMLSQDLDAVSTAARVGYNDASPFSREVKWLCGEPPRRHLVRRREATSFQDGQI